jgi:hypothetical protein
VGGVLPFSSRDLEGEYQSRPTASSYAARRLRLASFILGQLGSQGSMAYPPASRVSISELLGDPKALVASLRMYAALHVLLDRPLRIPIDRQL